MRIICCTLSKDSNSVCKADRLYNPTLRAAAIASSRLQADGTWPVIGEPSGLRGPWPDKWAIPSRITTLAYEPAGAVDSGRIIFNSFSRFSALIIQIPLLLLKGASWPL